MNRNAPKPNYEARLRALRNRLAATESDALLVTHFPNVGYLSGFHGGDSYLLVTASASVLISDGRYSEDIRRDCPSQETYIRESHQSLEVAAATVLSDSGVKNCDVEAGSITLHTFEGLKSQCDQINFRSSNGVVEELRQIKDEYELSRIRRAINIAESAFHEVVGRINASSTERDIEADFEFSIRKLGGRGTSFVPIIGAGYRAALPHGVPSGEKVADHDLLLIDWGVNEGEYLSDLTRVLPIVKPHDNQIDDRLKQTYEVVLASHLAAVEQLRPGIPIKEVDSAARRVLADGKIEEYFTHGLGHGFGLEIHESPRIAQKQTRELVAGMVVTIEPGVYFPDWGGIRIEDDYLITESGCERLTSISRDLNDHLLELK